MGRDKTIVDLLCAHPSVSKQHTVIQFRRTSKPDEFGLDQVRDWTGRETEQPLLM